MAIEDPPPEVPDRDGMTEEYSFDAVARGLASGTLSRRRALKLLGAAFLGGALSLVLLPDEAEARRRRRRRGPRCPSSGTGCDERCTNTTKDCACIRTTEGARVCVHPCCSDRRCNSSFGSRCRTGEVCMRTNCCNEGDQEGVCVKVCRGDRPEYCSSGATATEETSSGGWTPIG